MWIVAWFLFSLLVGVLAGKNGRNAFLAAVLAVIISPLFGFILYLILGESEVSRRERIIADEELRRAIREGKDVREIAAEEEPTVLQTRRFWLGLIGIVAVIVIFWGS